MFFYYDEMDLAHSQLVSSIHDGLTFEFVGLCASNAPLPLIWNVQRIPD